jgi:hypothetical protein
MDLDQNFIDTRPSILHDLHPSGRLLLGQTNPPLAKRFIGRELEITFLAKYNLEPGGVWLRVGYKTPLLGLKENYRLSKALSETVLVVDPPKTLEQSTLRLDFRLVPPLDQDLHLYLWPEKTELGIVDISLGGVRFAHDFTISFDRNQKLSVLIESEGKSLVTDASVVRSQNLQEAGKPKIYHTALHFEGMDQARRKQLSEILHRLLRFRLAHRSGMLDR